MLTIVYFLMPLLFFLPTGTMRRGMKLLFNLSRERMDSVFVGGTMFGIWGIILAVPVTIFVREFLKHFLNLNI